MCRFVSIANPVRRNVGACFRMCDAQTIKLFGSDIVQSPSSINNTIAFASGASNGNGLSSVVPTNIVMQSSMMHLVIDTHSITLKRMHFGNDDCFF